ncbi:4'-phosphopantetheinyl transferase superfamily protein [Streptomyces sp. NPDC048629]|uniref:4'-phosphopantetheinyl transferase family protein n=1 Tax=Streptomyces sp. NPDC048629 TaxID=3154824 RepID=UPI00343BB922
MSAALAVVRPGECHVWTARAVSVRSAAAPALLKLLDAGERARYEAFLRDDPRALYLTAHALLRELVSAELDRDPAELAFTAVCRHCTSGGHGKPRLPDSPLHLSLSHSGDRVAVALTYTGPVGVDVEQLTRPGEAPLMVLSAEERAAYDLLPEGERTRGFTRYWTRKEAVLKATGDGLSVDPALLTVSAPDAPAALLGWAEREQPHPPVRLYDVPVSGDCLVSVAVLGDDCRVVMHEVAYDGDGVLRRPRRTGA